MWRGRGGGVCAWGYGDGARARCGARGQWGRGTASMSGVARTRHSIDSCRVCKVCKVLRIESPPAAQRIFFSPVPETKKSFFGGGPGSLGSPILANPARPAALGWGSGSGSGARSALLLGDETAAEWTRAHPRRPGAREREGGACAGRRKRGDCTVHGEEAGVDGRRGTHLTVDRPLHPLQGLQGLRDGKSPRGPEIFFSGLWREEKKIISATRESWSTPTVQTLQGSKRQHGSRRAFRGLAAAPPTASTRAPPPAGAAAARLVRRPLVRRA